MDIAASIQHVTEEIILLITDNLYKEYKIDNLCLAGGVALNCVANGKILQEKIFDNIWIQPAAGDAAIALPTYSGRFDFMSASNIDSSKRLSTKLHAPMFSCSSWHHITSAFL